MPILTIAAEKGGCGKTLLTVNIAAAAQRAGLKKILIIDGDSREESYEWAMARKTAGLGKEIDIQKYSHEQSAEQQGLNISKEAANYDLTIIDTAATHSTFSNDAMISSDMVLTPFIVNEKDCRQKSIDRALKIHNVLNEHFPDIKTKILMTRVSTLNQLQQIDRVKQQISASNGSYLNSFLTDLNPFWKNWDLGMSCYESTLNSAKRAQNEADMLVMEILESCM
ncbi:ATPase involved in chromosome partitioning-like protein (plasmid) [Shewanella baltica OS223]|uniref:ParA family protein n=1 Tax=Shewanella baltica TaxID=62322 RepID=UPI00015307C3|nr:ParA family protein [Shewanella baltica]ACK48918.1 ATPase involved in chromosome partitioning-like protein [Shewanella baltica OS223]